MSLVVKTVNWDNDNGMVNVTFYPQPSEVFVIDITRIWTYTAFKDACRAAYEYKYADNATKFTSLSLDDLEEEDLHA